VAAIDFDLDLGAPEAEQTPASAAKEEVKSEAAALDISFDMPTMESAPPAIDFPLAAETPAAAPEAPAAPAVQAVAAADSGGIDFEFDLGTPVPAVPEPSPEVSLELPELAATLAPTAPVLDLGGISLELDAPAGAASAGADASGGEKPDNPEVATKMELAMAYEEMGDRDGARELYQEALAEGGSGQQKAARAKLDSLG
jgi:pilus assembly protein FimV